MKLLQLEELLEGTYKAVHLRISGESCLYFADTYEYARDILATILNRHGLDYEIVQLRHGKGPAPKSEKYTVYGIGCAACIEKDGRKSITLSGDSVDYCLPMSKAPLELIKEKYPNVEFLVTEYR